MTYFTADLHFGHRGVIQFCNRPWATPEEMDEGLIQRWNETVQSEKDWVIICGDMFFCGIKRIKEIMPRLRGQKILVLGNHDWDKVKPHRAQELGFSIVLSQIGYMPIGLRHLVVCSHFPYDGDHTYEDRFVMDRPVNRGDWLVHGHVHQAWKVKRKQINVGVDVWDWRPVPETMIEQIIETNKNDIDKYGLEEG